MTVVVLLLVNHLLQFGEQLALVESLVLRQRKEHCHCQLQVQISVYVLFIEFLHHCLLELRTGNVAECESHYYTGKGRSLVAGEGLYPLHRDGSDDCVEVVIDDQVVPSDLVVDCPNVIIGEQLEVVLVVMRGTLTRAAIVLQLGEIYSWHSRAENF